MQRIFAQKPKSCEQLCFTKSHPRPHIFVETFHSAFLKSNLKLKLEALRSSFWLKEKHDFDPEAKIQPIWTVILGNLAGWHLIKVTPFLRWLNVLENPWMSHVFIIQHQQSTCICLFDAWKVPNIFSQMVVEWWFTMVQCVKNHHINKLWFWLPQLFWPKYDFTNFSQK